MNAVGILGSYITQGVYKVSGTFHPFGGAVDIIVVQQPDGSFKSSPWYVQFGKFQGVLKTKEKIVSISVNGVEAGIHMYLDHKGEAHFLKEIETEDGDHVILPATSGAERDEKLGDAQFKKTEICNYDDSTKDLVTSKCVQNGKVLSRVSSQRSRILGLMFGRRSIKLNGINGAVSRVDSLERAEIAADLLELKWSTNLLGNNGFQYNKFNKEEDSPNKAPIGKGEPQEMPLLDVELDRYEKTSASLVHDFGISNKHFEEKTNCDYVNLRDEGMLVEVSASEREDTRLGTSSMDDSNSGDSDRSMETEVHFEETFSCPSGLSGHKVAPKISFCSSGNNELSTLTVGVKSCAVSAKSDDSCYRDVNFDVQSPYASAISHEMAHGLNKTCDASAFGLSTGESGEQEATCCNTLKNLPANYAISSEQASSTPHHLPFHPFFSADDDLTVHSEMVGDKTSVIFDLNLGLTNSVSVDAQKQPSSNEAFVSEKILDEFHPPLNAGLLKFDSGNSFQDVVIEKHNLENDRSTVFCSFPGNQLERDKYLNPCSNSLLMSDQTTGSDGKSKLHSIGNFNHSLNEFSQLDKVGNFDINGLRNSYLSNVINNSQDSNTISRTIVVEARAKSPKNSEDDQFLFSDVDDFGSNEIKLDTSFRAADEKEEPHLLYADEGVECHTLNGSNEIKLETPFSAADEKEEPQLLYSNEGVECHTLKVASGEESSESLLERSITQTSPMTIPRIKTYVSSKSLPAIRSYIHDLEGSYRSSPLSISLDLSFAKTNGHLPRMDCSSTLNVEDGSQTKVEQDSHIYEVVASTLDINNDHVSKDIPICPTVELSLCGHLLYEGMGLGAAFEAFNSEKISMEKFHALGSPLLKNEKLVARIGGRYLPWSSAAPIVLEIIAFGVEPIFRPQDVIMVERAEKNGLEDPSIARVSSEGSWKLWPFGFKRSKTIKVVQLTREGSNQLNPGATTLTSKSLSKDDFIQKPKNMKKKVRLFTPSSEEIASLNLKEGSNVVTFRFSTAMLGQQQVDARIYLWKWNTQIVISDVDGTITRSDVLGQFMPLVGINWLQTGVAHLFSAIKENGYQLLFLSARAISQAYLTRQFLFNLKQDGKELPHGPVVISPDGLFPSLYREVIRRAPHEFKISCLEAIMALFPSDCNPFYAGFGNRDTDEISYLKVGIPRGKIFTINPKGEVAVNRSVDTKSYTSLHALVNGMFPPVFSREQEDFNSWNYWKMPLPEIVI